MVEIPNYNKELKFDWLSRNKDIKLSEIAVDFIKNLIVLSDLYQLIITTDLVLT